MLLVLCFYVYLIDSSKTTKTSSVFAWPNWHITRVDWQILALVPLGCFQYGFSSIRCIRYYLQTSYHLDSAIQKLGSQEVYKVVWESFNFERRQIPRVAWLYWQANTLYGPRLWALFSCMTTRTFPITYLLINLKSIQCDQFNLIWFRI